jgi:hypothetical protein
MLFRNSLIKIKILDGKNLEEITKKYQEPYELEFVKSVYELIQDKNTRPFQF